MTEADRAVLIGTGPPRPVGTVSGGYHCREFSAIALTSMCGAMASGHWRWRWHAASTPQPIRCSASDRIFMRVAAFDHSQIRHTRHVRPIRLEWNKCGRFAR